MKRRNFMTAIALALCLGGPVKARAGYPERPVTVIVPYSAGGATDTLARIIAGPLGEALGQPVVIENKPGAGGAIGAETMVNSDPDGYTVLFHTATVSVYPTTKPELDFDAREDFQPVMLATRAPFVIAVRGDLEMDNLNDLIDYAKANPGMLNHGSPGTGTSTQLAAELFKQRTGAEMAHIPYGGSSAVLTATRSGEIDFMLDTYLGIQGAVESGDVKALAVGTSNRQQFNPAIPTMAEQGIDDFELFAWFGYSVPKGTPEEIVNTLHDALVVALQNERVKAVVEAQGEVVASTPEELARQIATEVDIWSEVAREAGVTK
ncbi:MAG: tripartite tricarboxylate transporter substrate binding protein [Martelella sp.]|uniref:Bug family tripartite tricarboxylate transporter substrate binding protein n=1 Tax=Martelella sp. TaxID=1969699 RepID=UPI0032428913